MYRNSEVVDGQNELVEKQIRFDEKVSNMKNTQHYLTQNFTKQSQIGFEDFSDSEIPGTPDSDKFKLHSIESSVMNKGTVKKSD